MRTFTQLFDGFLDAVQSILLSVLVRIGPFFVALMPALFTAYSIYHTFKVEAGHELALFFAGVVGLAMETVGIIATHTAIDLYNAKQQGLIAPGKFRLLTWLIPVYVFGVAGVVAFSKDAFTPLVKSLGIASPFLTCVVYIAVALARDLADTRARQDAVEERETERENDERQFERKKELLELELKHKERMARIVQKTVKMPSNTTVKQPDNRTPNIYRHNPDAGVTEISRRLGVSRQTIYNYLEELEQAKRIDRDERGVVVVLNGKMEE